MSQSEQPTIPSKGAKHLGNSERARKAQPTTTDEADINSKRSPHNTSRSAMLSQQNAGIQMGGSTRAERPWTRATTKARNPASNQDDDPQGEQDSSSCRGADDARCTKEDGETWSD